MSTTPRITLATSLLLAAVPPAAAQEGLGTVVCVGSQVESMAGTGPVRRMIRKDVELVYRVAVELTEGDQIEAGLRGELGGNAEVRCVWSESTNDRMVVLSYTGVVALGRTPDPDDPRFQGFSVGYGTDWDDAEANARADARFDTYYDGSGYEVIVREEWTAGVAGGVTAKEPDPPEPGAAEQGGDDREPARVFRDCAACPEMVVVPAGSFMMGSPDDDDENWMGYEGPQHRVTIRSPFAVGVYEVTFAEWDACARAGGCGGYRPEDEGWGRGSRPVINVSWEDAQEYVRWLSRNTGEAYRLLTDAEWEYVARAGTTTRRYWGDSRSGQCRYANGLDAAAREEYPGWASVSCSDGYVHTAPVGSFEPNAFGLYDVLGNVSEWTLDCWNESYWGAPTDGSAWRSGDCSYRVVRGGAYGTTPPGLRSASRNSSSPGNGNRYEYRGFRVARTVN